ANPADDAALSVIARAAKAYWGYPAHWLEEWREELTITPDFIAENETFKAIMNGHVIAFHALLESGATWRLEHLWVQPERMGEGIGRALFRHAVSRATARGASCLTIESDPHAEAFYRHMGAQRVGLVGSKIDGQLRQLPLLEFDLARPSTPLP
ncbi:MAG: GNAT family N-acetyltransferase, partial [Chthoniobacterales bacterium]|nr:GNAT family N-acetyltransferase [Chthoniobacterales bacterium]